MQFFETFSEECTQVIDSASHVLPLLSSRAVYADLFYEHSLSHSFFQSKRSALNAPGHKEQRIVQNQGVGLYAFNDKTQGFHSLPGVPDRAALTQAAQDLARELTGPIAFTTTQIHLPHHRRPISLPDNPALILEPEKKRLLEDLIEQAFSFEPRLTSASGEYQDHIRNTCIINSERKIIEHAQAWLGIRLHVTLEIEGRVIQANGTRYVKDQFGLLAFNSLNELVLETIQRARHIQASQPVQSGKYAILFAGSATQMPGQVSKSNASLWLHECVGHMLEVDQAPLYGLSPGAETPVTLPIATLVDSPYHPESSVDVFDDEGIAAHKTTLIANGQLNHLLSDRYHAHMQGVLQTGNGYRQGYKHPPLPRMSSLYLEPGDTPGHLVLSSIDKGIYIKSIQQGHTLPGSNHFHLLVNEGFFIENGVLTHPVSNLTIKGDCLNTLQNIQCIGDDLPAHPRIVKCHKKGQVVPVSVNCPSVLIENLEVIQNK